MPGAPSPRLLLPGAATLGPQLRDLSEEVHCSILLYLGGSEAASLSALGHFARRVLAQDPLWATFVRQEFGAHTAEEPSLALDTYRTLRSQQLCRTLTWRQVPVWSQLGEREGSPGVFSCNGYLFVFGGWGHYGPEQDLHAAPLEEVPLTFQSIPIQGASPMPPTYEAKLTLLEDPDAPAEPSAASAVRAVVTGGYLRGGYSMECARFGVLEVRFPPSGQPQAAWVHAGAMEARSNHSATFVPPRIAGQAYPKGYLLVYGGTKRGRTVGDVELLDLDTYTWSEPVVASQEMAPRPRNSHSATLLRGPGRIGDAVLVVGGADGDGTNGGPPRGGQEMNDSFWLSGLEGARLVWARAGSASPGATSRGAGRGHVAWRIGRTNTVVAFSGGRPPEPGFMAFCDGEVRGEVVLGGSRGPPQPRAFGGGCSLADGSLLLFGGWHMHTRTFGDIWVGYAGTKETHFVSRLPAPPERAQPDVEVLASGSDGEEDREVARRFLPFLQTLAGNRGDLHEMLSWMRRHEMRANAGRDSEDEEGDDDDDDEGEDEGSEDGEAAGREADEEQRDADEEDGGDGWAEAAMEQPPSLWQAFQEAAAAYELQAPVPDSDGEEALERAFRESMASEATPGAGEAAAADGVVL